jgi:hypothetical protein
MSKAGKHGYADLRRINLEEAKGRVPQWDVKSVWRALNAMFRMVLKWSCIFQIVFYAKSEHGIVCRPVAFIDERLLALSLRLYHITFHVCQ